MDSSYPLILLLLFLFSGLFSASETAFFSLNTLRLERLAKEGNRKAKEVLKLLRNPAELIATILVGNEIVNVGISATSTVLFVSLFGEKGTAIAIPTTVIFLLIFGEVTPKTLAIKYSERYAFFILPFIKTAKVVLFPIRIFLVSIATIILKPFKVELFSKPPVITDEEFLILVSEGAKEGIIKEEEKELINRTLDLGETLVKEVMTPKYKIFALQEDTPVKEAIKLIKETRFSRIPLYGNSIDQITGILHRKRILPTTLSERELNLPVKEFASKPLFTPEFQTIDRLLEKMQREKKHMAIVIDEYGNTAGLVTMDDIINEIVGTLPEKEEKREEKDFFIFSGETPIEEVSEALSLEEDRTLKEVDTLAGLLMALTKEIPSEGTTVNYQNYNFKVLKTKGNRIEKVKVWKQ